VRGKLARKTPNLEADPFLARLLSGFEGHPLHRVTEPLNALATDFLIGCFLRPPPHSPPLFGFYTPF